MHLNGQIKASNNILSYKVISVPNTRYLISKICYSKNYHFLKVFKSRLRTRLYSYTNTRIIPTSLAGNDLIGCAQTGTGKTAALLSPIIHQLHRIVSSKKS
jgi:ATP-dependent helicase YprA (DUF1998 family)